MSVRYSLEDESCELTSTGLRKLMVRVTNPATIVNVL